MRVASSTRQRLEVSAGYYVIVQRSKNDQQTANFGITHMTTVELFPQTTRFPRNSHDIWSEPRSIHHWSRTTHEFGARSNRMANVKVGFSSPRSGSQNTDRRLSRPISAASRPGVGQRRSSDWTNDANVVITFGTSPLMSSRIEDYALIGDCETAALVSQGRLHRLALLAPLRLGRLFCRAARRPGAWPLADRAAGGCRRAVSRRYRGDTLILETRVRDRRTARSRSSTSCRCARAHSSTSVRLVVGKRGRVRDAHGAGRALRLRRARCRG